MNKLKKIKHFNHLTNLLFVFVLATTALANTEISKQNSFVNQLTQNCYKIIQKQIEENLAKLKINYNWKSSNASNSFNGDCSTLGSITVSSVTVSPCNSSTNNYSLDAIITYSSPPTGNINLTTSNGHTISVAQTGSPQTISLTDLTSDGIKGIDVTAVFSNDASCTNTLLEAYDAPFSCYGQIQSEFSTPTILTACNLDTFCLEISNLSGIKDGVYEDVNIEFNLPNADLFNILTDDIHSTPAGVVLSSYTNDVLSLSIPMPEFGSTTEICVIFRPDCEITSITPLPQLHATITYPTGYPISTESVTSAPMNVGAVSLTHTLFNQTTFGNPTPAFGASYRIISWLKNTGYGSQNEVVYKTVIPNTHTSSSIYVYLVNTAGVYDYSVGHQYEVSSEPYDAEHDLLTFVFSDLDLGADGLFRPEERLRLDHYLRGTNECASFSSKRWAEISCGENEPSCITPDTLFSTITQAAGTPALTGTLISIEDADGCPEKEGIFSIENTGTAGANSVGNAYDVDLSISFGSGLMQLSNIQMNGMAVPSANLTPDGLAATSTTIKLKDLMTTDPDGAGVGIEDLDMDGFYDDMEAGAMTQISFDYTVPCDVACGAQLDYNLSSSNTFTDFCRALNGSTSTELHRFGFEQVQAIEQTEEVDYGFLTTGESATETAKFQFQYKQHNMDFTNAAGELRIQYNERMEVDPTSILINGAAPTNTPILMGDNSTGGLPDTDSMYVVVLSSAELTALFDENPDSLWYDQTYYGCDVRQNTNVGDNWQLIVQINQNLCADGSSACEFDVACKKPFVYTYNTGCGVKPCYIQEVKTYRESPSGFTSVDETSTISSIDSTRSWTGDTIVMQNSFFITGDAQHEPNGYWTALNRANLDISSYFSIKYSTPVGWAGQGSIWTFLPSYSTVSVYQRTPDSDSTQIGTIGAKIIEVPILLSDFASNFANKGATTQDDFNEKEYNYPSTEYSAPVWYCNNSPTSWHVNGVCPVQNRYWHDDDYTNIQVHRYRNEAEDKISETYQLNFGKALARGGWTGNTGDDNYYFEVKTKWEMNEDFPWDNSNSFTAIGAVRHLGNYADFPTNYQSNLNSSYNGACGSFGTTHLTTSKEHLIGNPNAVYSSDCSLDVNHDIFFNSYEGDYFAGSEVRVPLKVDSVVIDLPSEYGLTAGTFNWMYNQGCGDLNSTAISSSATTGHIIFTNSAGGDFPRADDCSGNKVAYQLAYTIEKIGTAAPTQYKYPVTIYGRNESDEAVILLDSVAIAEVKPELTVTPLSPILTPADGGACEPAFFDFRIQNNTLFDASHVYLAAESTADITMVNIDDGTDIYTDPINPTDVSLYGANNVFAKIGTIKAGEIRKVRVYGNTNTCSGDFNVYVDFGCDYPSPLEPNLASPTIEQTSAQYLAQAPGITSLPVSDININTLCDVQTVEVEIRNIRLGNLYNGNVLFDLPAGASLMAGSAQYRFINVAAAEWSDIPIADVTTPSSDQINLDLSNTNPFNTVCGLEGSDDFALSHFRVRFDLDFSTCPTTSVDYVLYNASGENFCGTESSTQGVVKINYIGDSGTLNDYSVISSSNPVIVCARRDEAQIINDTLSITNIGGYGAASGTSSGLETFEISILNNPLNFELSDFSLSTGFDAPTFSTDSHGNLVLITNIPAGIDVDSSYEMIVSYTITPKIDNVCTLNDSAMCYSMVIKNTPDLSCPTAGLDCSSSFAAIVANEFSIRPFKCCKVGIGNLVFIDIAGDGIFDPADEDVGVDGMIVELYSADSIPGVNMSLSTTTTAGGGYYLFDQLELGEYIVYMPASNFASGSPLLHTNNDEVEGTDDDNDDDGNENGQNTLVSGGIQSGVIVLWPNSEPTGETGAGSYTGELDDDDVNMTVDFGFTPEFDYPDFSDSGNRCNNAPCHIISEHLYLGSSVDEEDPVFGDLNANNDTDNGIALNENLQFVANNTINIPVTVYNNTGSVAYLRMWMDWNGDGDFEDAGEQIEDTTHASTGTSDVVYVTVTIPSSVVQNQDIALRTRLSTDDTDSATACGTGNCAADGEVEDYLIQVNCPAQVCTPVSLTTKSGRP
jgi:hypothetical protein